MATLHMKLLYILPILLAIGINAQPKPGVQVQPQPGVQPAQPQQTAQPNAGAGVVVGDGAAQPNFPVNGIGTWQVINNDPGLSVMHINLLPNNKVIMFDAQATHQSHIKYPNNECVTVKDERTKADIQDCQAHGIEYDLATNTARALKFLTDAWCSSGGIMPDGRFVNTGGFWGGYHSIRYFTPCNDGKCNLKDYPDKLADPRWYSTQITLGDGRIILVGGRKAYSFEFLPQEGQENEVATNLLFLDETSDQDENNLYPFVNQVSDGSVFIFANNRSILLDVKTNKVIKELPALPGGSRNYPASGMSTLLPIDLKEQNPQVIPNDIIVCGGNTHDAFRLVENKLIKDKVSKPALTDCGTIRITDPNPVWDKEIMPSQRVMGDMLNLPTGDLLIINGAQAGTSAWWDADDPNFTPLIYNPKMPKGQRFFKMAPTMIPRMYHSTSAVLPSGKILVSGSNPNEFYEMVITDRFKYLTELRIETFTPPYMDPALDIHRPVINTHDKKLKYAAEFAVQFKLNEADKPTKAEIKVTMYAVPFTTHGYSMNQRLLNLANKELKAEGPGVYGITVFSPPNGNIAPPGYYLLNVVHRGVPSPGVWVSINN